MIPLRFDFGEDGASTSIRCVVGRRFGAYAVRLDGLQVDNRYLPGTPALVQRWQALVFAVRGELRFEGVPLGAHEVIVARPRSLTALGGPAPRVASGNSELIGLRIRAEDVVHPTEGVERAAVSESTAALLRALAPAVRKGNLEETLARTRTVMRALASDGILVDGANLPDEETERSLVERAVSSIFPIVSRLATKPMLVDVVAATGIGERQIHRDFMQVQAEFDLLDRGWRQSLVRWRTTVAVLLLSVERLSIEQIASLAGYSGPTALGRALRDAGLPTAGIIRAGLRHA